MPSGIAWGLLGLALHLAPDASGPRTALAAPPRVSGVSTSGLPVRSEVCNHPPPAVRDTTRAARANELPDFAITDVEAPSRVYWRGPFEVSVTVCNEGSRAGSTDVSVFASRDPCITKEDALLGSVPSGWLGAGACESRSITARKDASHSGTWFVGALADPEAQVAEVSEENNSAEGVPVTFDSLPDFVVESVSMPAVVLPDAHFQVYALVCNRGQGDEVTSVRLYQSPDAHIESDDVVLNYVTGLFLQAGRCERVVFDGWIHQPGTWYVAVMADALNERPEDVESNNLSAVTTLEVGSIPDYVVAALRAPPVELSNGTLPVRTTVCNQGTADGAATQMRFQLRASEPSAEGVLSVSSRSIPALASHQCTEWEEPLGSLGNAARSWRLVATVNPAGAQTEAHLDNNDRAVDVLLGTLADLSVTRVAPLTHALAPGDFFTTEVTVCNTGSTSAPSVAVHVALSEDPDPRVGIRVGTRSFGPLGKGCAVLPVVGTVPAQGLPDTVFVKASVELSVPQGVDPHLENNALLGPEVGIGTGPDLVVTKIETHGRVSWRGGALPAAVSVCNRGSVQTPQAFIQTLFLPEPDLDASPGIGGPMLTVAPLAPGACVALETVMTAPLFEGAWRPVAWGDVTNAVTELVETNNDAAGEVVQVTQISGLVITDLQAPTMVRLNESFVATATVCNRSPVSQPGTRLTLALRTEDDFPVSVLSDYSGAPGLVQGECAQVRLYGVANVPLEGAFRLVAQVGEPWGVRSPEQWRALAFSVPMAVGGQNDFAVTAVSASGVIRRGVSYPTTVTVCNRGLGIGSASVKVYLSRDEHLEPSGDVRVGQASVTLGPSQCRTLTVSSLANVSSGDVWYVGAHASAGSTPDLVPANDGRVGSRVVVTP
ncbi:CARDB domain-containing protein [Myxococcus xanthus]|uniref:CARDB domain-containing protein n=1 Tax=Myxococcus xanthus TaxID=34 RepID=A0A7Y4II01_MYXXA|nr:CARDB domain-containing protein [Myxococcus xanthus]NOJ79519.1 hypothetical protein [Myxococcus xanthus]NOJ86075.1 hypothetical protein [Myxococcus xanthus]